MHVTQSHQKDSQDLLLLFFFSVHSISQSMLKPSLFPGYCYLPRNNWKENVKCPPVFIFILFQPCQGNLKSPLKTELTHHLFQQPDQNHPTQTDNSLQG